MMRALGWRPDRVVTSPLRRCVETAEIVAASAGFPAPLPDDAFTEIDCGEATGRAFTDLEREHPGFFLRPASQWLGFSEFGGESDDVVSSLERRGLTPANMNGAGQIVAAGTMEQLGELRAEPPAKARVIPLQVAGAFHTHHMAPAVDGLAKAAEEIAPGDPKLTYVSNKDGQAVATGAEVLSRLVGQVANPVRWDLCMETFKELGVTALVEVCPGGTLTGPPYEPRPAKVNASLQCRGPAPK